MKKARRKSLLIIGSSGGIGKKTTEILLKNGYSVIGTYFQDEEQLENLKKVKNFTAYPLDLKSLESIRKLHGFVKKKFNSLFAVVNCSGIVDFEGKNLDKDFKVWNETIAVNLTGNYFLAKLFYNNISQNGRFIMISSTDSFYGGSITASYAASKAGVNSLTKSLSLAFRDKKIRVNSIAPGWVSTPMIEGESDEFYKKLAETNPLGRIAEPEDIAEMIRFLLSGNSDYLNGQIITLDGGYTSQDPTLLIEEETKE